MIEFTSIIRQKEGMNAAFVEFPFSTQELFGKKGQVKVRAVFDGRVEYRGSLARMGSTCHLLGLTQEVRTRLGKSFGDTVKVELEEDKEERIATLPKPENPKPANDTSRNCWKHCWRVTVNKE